MPRDEKKTLTYPRYQKEFKEVPGNLDNKRTLWVQLLALLPCEVMTLGGTIRFEFYKAEYRDGDIRFEPLGPSKNLEPLKVTKAIIDEIDTNILMGSEIRVDAANSEPVSETLDWYCKQHTSTMVCHVLAPLLIRAGWKVTKGNPMHLTRQ